MYHCHLRFYCISPQRAFYDPMKEAAPLPHFTHEFWQSDALEPQKAAKADVIFADLRGIDEKAALTALAAAQKQDAELIVLADPEQRDSLAASPDGLERVADIWPAELTPQELAFRFARWQQAMKTRKDFWQTNHYFEATIDNIPNLIWYKDKNGIHKKVNESFCKTVNKTKAQVEGQSHAYIWDVEEDDPACIESEREVMNKRQTCVSEEVVKTKDGSKLLTTYKSPLYDLDGSVMGTVGVAIDITQERAYQKEIITKNQMMENIFTALDCGVLCHTIDGSQILSVNKAALHILGYESQEQLMEAGFDMVAESVVDEDKEQLRQAIRSLKNEGDSVSVKYRVRHSNGNILHIMGSVKLLEENGQLFFQRFLLDYTEQKLQETRKQMEQERRQMELMQALSIDYNLVCSFNLDTGLGSALRINDCKVHILDSIFSGDLIMQDCMERYIHTCVYSEDREAMRLALSPERLQEALAENKTCYVNYRTLCNGEMRYFQMKAVRVGSWNHSRGVVLGFRSVDEETRRELEKKSLLEDALIQANRASKAKSVFLSNMSHDIRTPMNAIIGFTTLAVAHIDRKDRVEGYLKKIMTSGNHLLSLINDILDMSHIESGKIQLEEKPCSLPEILQGLRSIVQADVYAKQQTFHMDLSGIQNEQICCDKLRLNQVLLNLLSNAVKYTDAGGAISMTALEKPGAPEGFANYQFIVQDNGIGMSQEFVCRIFEPFERERNSTLSGIQGTGLGMSITKNIVDLMNGSISVESRQGAGTRVCVSFTFRLYTETEEALPIPGLENCPVLIVDSNAGSGESTSHMLQQMGMRTALASSGKEALRLVRQAVQAQDLYRLYVADWQLSDMSGVEFIRSIRQQAGENISVIALTESDWASIEEEAREAGVAAFGSKPLLMSELRRCLLSLAEAKPLVTQNAGGLAKRREGRILLTEDNELNQEIAVAILSEAGFEVDVAENGRQALEMLQSAPAGHYQLVLMDIQMPVMNGYQAAQAIRSLPDPELASVPIIAMTANAFEEDKQAALKHGMNGHIAKPIDIDILFAALDKILA